MGRELGSYGEKELEMEGSNYSYRVGPEAPVACSTFGTLPSPGQGAGGWTGRGGGNVRGTDRGELGIERVAGRERKNVVRGRDRV